MGKLCLIILVSVCACGAQTTRPLRGEIHSDAVEDLSWLSVRLDSPGFGRGASASVSFRGDFEFQGVPSGFYTLRVLDGSGAEILSQSVNLGGANPPVAIRLPRIQQTKPAGETVSIARLRHKVPKPAMKVAQKAEKLSAHGDFQHAAEQWQKAIAADPEFSEAYGNLGTQYVRLSQPSLAVEAYRHATALDPYTAGHQTNLAFALAQLGQLEEAEAVVRGSLKLNDTNPLTHYVLGCVLTMRNRSMGEAVEQLKIASRQFARAHQVLATIYQAQGNQAMAASELEQYQETLVDPGSKMPGSRNALVGQ